MSAPEPDLPADLAAVQADDALLDALGQDASTGLALEHLVLLQHAWLTQTLLAWRRDVESEPMPRLMDTDTALALIRRRSEQRGLRRLARWLRTALRGARW